MAMHQTTERQPERGGSEVTPTAAAILEDGGLVELLYDPKAKRTSLAVWRNQACEVVPSLDLPSGERLCRTRLTTTSSKTT